MGNGVRGKDRIPYGQFGNHRKPGNGRPAKWPWRTWLGEARTWELDFGSLQEARRARASIAVRVSKANRALSGAGSPGWVAHRFTLPRSAPGAVTAELTFWWFPEEGAEPVDQFPEQVLDLFARRSHQSGDDAAAERARLRVPAYPAEWQERAVAVLCPSQYRAPLETLNSPAFDHWRGWKPNECEDCSAEPGPVDLGAGQ